MKEENKGDKSETKTTDLRKRAEEIASGKASPENIDKMSPEERRMVLHELRVHQIELEMQNGELRRIHAELDAERIRYFDLYNLAPVGYLTLSEKGLILEANLTAATLLGMSRGALVKQPISRFILKEDQDIYYLHRKQLFDTGEPQECDLRLVKPDGVRFWALLKATAAQAEDGAPVCRCVISDITERKQIEEEIRRLNAEMEQRVAQRTAELTAKTSELEHINKVFVGRELRMRELKEQIAELEKKEK